MPLVRRGRRRDPHARRPRSAPHRRRRGLWLRARREAGRGSRRGGLGTRLDAPHGGEPRLGARPDAGRGHGSGRARRACAWDPPRRGGALPRDGRARARPFRAGLAAAHALQHGRPRDRRRRHGARRDRARLGGGPRRHGARGRDAAAPPGRAPHGLGAPRGGRPVFPRRRRGRAGPDRPWRGDARRRRRRPDRRERRHRQQGRHLPARARGGARPDPVRRRRAHDVARPRDPDGRGDPDRGAPGRRGQRTLRRAEPGVRRHARRS